MGSSQSSANIYLATNISTNNEKKRNVAHHPNRRQSVQQWFANLEVAYRENKKVRRVDNELFRETFPVAIFMYCCEQQWCTCSRQRQSTLVYSQKIADFAAAPPAWPPPSKRPAGKASPQIRPTYMCTRFLLFTICCSISCKNNHRLNSCQYINAWKIFSARNPVLPNYVIWSNSNGLIWELIEIT